MYLYHMYLIITVTATMAYKEILRNIQVKAKFLLLLCVTIFNALITTRKNRAGDQMRWGIFEEQLTCSILAVSRPVRLFWQFYWQYGYNRDARRYISVVNLITGSKFTRNWNNLRLLGYKACPVRFPGSRCWNIRNSTSNFPELDT